MTTYRMHQVVILDFRCYSRRALREKDPAVFDELASKARQHASAAGYCAHLDPTTGAFLPAETVATEGAEHFHRIRRLRAERYSASPGRGEATYHP